MYLVTSVIFDFTLNMETSSTTSDVSTNIINSYEQGCEQIYESIREEIKQPPLYLDFKNPITFIEKDVDLQFLFFMNTYLNYESKLKHKLKHNNNSRLLYMNCTYSFLTRMAATENISHEQHLHLLDNELAAYSMESYSFETFSKKMTTDLNKCCEHKYTINTYIKQLRNYLQENIPELANIGNQKIHNLPILIYIIWRKTKCIGKTLQYLLYAIVNNDTAFREHFGIFLTSYFSFIFRPIAITSKNHNIVHVLALCSDIIGLSCMQFSQNELYVIDNDGFLPIHLAAEAVENNFSRQSLFAFLILCDHYNVAYMFNDHSLGNMYNLMYYILNNISDTSTNVNQCHANGIHSTDESSDDEYDITDAVLNKIRTELLGKSLRKGRIIELLRDALTVDEINNIGALKKAMRHGELPAVVDTIREKFINPNRCGTPPICIDGINNYIFQANYVKYLSINETFKNIYVSERLPFQLNTPAHLLNIKALYAYLKLRNTLSDQFSFNEFIKAITYAFRKVNGNSTNTRNKLSTTYSGK